MSDTVHHPQHYGGEANPYETIKVLRAWMTPQEFAGFLKGNAIKYQTRHRLKGGLEDLKKSVFYSEALADFIQEEGHSTVYPRPLFWTEADPEPVEDPYEILRCGGYYVPIALHSNVEPYVQWFVHISIGDEEGYQNGDEILDFPSREKAWEYCDDAGKVEPVPVDLPDADELSRVTNGAL